MKVGDIVVTTNVERKDITNGKPYVIFAHGSTYVDVYDDVGAVHCLGNGEVKVVGHISNATIVLPPSLIDCQGDIVNVGDYIAYACSDHVIRIYQIAEIKSPPGTAEVCTLETGSRFRLGNFEQRALKLEGYKE